MATFRVSVQHAEEVERALAVIPAEAKRAIARHARKLAKELANRIRSAGQAESRQAARAARTVRTRGTKVTAGPDPVLFGSEFGANGRYGWYGADRFQDSTARQFKPHRGQNSYWFHTTIEHNQPLAQQELQEAVDEVVSTYRRVQG
jgi:hypothetical protein